VVRIAIVPWVHVGARGERSTRYDRLACSVYKLIPTGSVYRCTGFCVVRWPAH